MNTMLECCIKCGGLIPEPGKTYGYSGPMCNCQHSKVEQYDTFQVNKSLNYLVNEIQKRDKEIRDLKDKLESIHLDYAEGESRRDSFEEENE